VTSTTTLGARDRETIVRARELAGLPAGTIREFAGEDDLTMAYGVALGRAQWDLGQLLAIIERLAGAE
jgi:hypothetical protein